MSSLGAVPLTAATYRERIARTAFLIVAGFSVANLCFNLWATGRGWAFPWTNYLFLSADNFSDFFSLLCSYPGGEAAKITNHIGLNALVPVDPPSQMIVRNSGLPAAVTHFHMMPLPTIVDLLLLKLIRVVDPALSFFTIMALILAGWCAAAFRGAATRREAAYWALLGLGCYPMLLMVVRGNLYAGFTALALLHAMLLGLRRQHPRVAAVLLAIAVNIRPNAILFAVPLLFFFCAWRWRFMTTLALAGTSIVTLSFGAATMLYPAYHPATFLEGLRLYHELYVGQGWGLASGSSLWGALTLLFEPRPMFEPAALLASLALLGAGALGWWFGKIDEAFLLFVTASAYCLGSTVLADYHLIVLLIVPMAIAMAPPGDDAETATLRRIALVATALILAPKNYLFLGPGSRPVSLQAVLNPLILLVPSLLILSKAITPFRQARPLRLAAAGSKLA